MCANPIGIGGEQGDLIATIAQDTARCNFGYRSGLTHPSWTNEGKDPALIKHRKGIDRFDHPFNLIARTLQESGEVRGLWQFAGNVSTQLWRKASVKKMLNHFGEVGLLLL